MREREEEAGARGGPTAVHPPLQHRRLHDHGQHQQAGDQEKGTELDKTAGGICSGISRGTVEMPVHSYLFGYLLVKVVKQP